MAPKTRELHGVEFYREMKCLGSYPSFYRIVLKSEISRYLNEKQTVINAIPTKPVDRNPSSSSTKHDRTLAIARRGMNKYHEALLELAK